MTEPLLHVLGDSISMQYGPYLEKMLQGVMIYSRKQPATSEPDSANGGDSSMALAYLRERIAQAPVFNLLLLNCGLHDIKHNPGAADTQVPLAAYPDNLRAILSLAHEQAVQVVWVRTTPVADEIHNSRSTSFKRYNADVLAFNAAADQVMAKAGIPVIDLYTFTSNLGSDLYIDHVHFNDAVRMQQAAFIAGRLYTFI